MKELVENLINSNANGVKIAEMEKTLVDEKIENLLGVLNWDIRYSTDTNSTFDDLFSIG